ncbi:MAG TPA: methylmalonyl-CoA epimerase, partial [Acidobacteria bacterium]|nr:methylmalonyl-CoA epimerase [Acidobacteriota bacterium]
LDHIGIVVRSLEEGLAFYQALGLVEKGREEVPEQGVRVAFLPAGEARLELLEPTGPDSPIARFLERRGPGIHHICLQVSDIRSTMDRLRGEGFELLSDEPQAGAHGSLVCFVHPRSAGGVLLELSQRGAGEG